MLCYDTIFSFDIITIFDLIRQFIPKTYYSISKVSYSLVDIVFEICLDSKFPVWKEMLKKYLP